ncbi:MAG: hypothetical protein L6406_26125 [Desulfobacterales bacterium]|nr:hypothetical protein [Desulfobacterales bacterium]
MSGIPRLSYRVDHAALQRLSQERLGRTVLVSDHTQWSTRQKKLAQALEIGETLGQKG